MTAETGLTDIEVLEMIARDRAGLLGWKRIAGALERRGITATQVSIARCAGPLSGHINARTLQRWANRNGVM